MASYADASQEMFVHLSDSGSQMVDRGKLGNFYGRKFSEHTVCAMLAVWIQDKRILTLLPEG